MIPAEPKERRTADGGALMYLSCPACRAEYPILSITAKGLRLRRLLEKARAELPRRQARHDRLLTEFQAETSRPG